MKKTLLFSLVLFLSIVFIGCKKDTTYQIYNNCTKEQTSVQYLDGSLYEVVIYEYLGNDVIRQVNIDKISSGGGKSDIITANEKTEKIKVSFRLLPKQSAYYNLSSNNRKYTVQYYFLEEGKLTIAEINGNTMVGGSMKISKNEQNSGITINKSIQEIIEK